MKLVFKVLLAPLLCLAIFVSGVITGNHYKVVDILCPMGTSPHKLDRDFESPSGIVIPKGTVVPLRQCAYMQRFLWEFGIENAVIIPAATKSEKDDYGYSELSPKSSE